MKTVYFLLGTLIIAPFCTINVEAQTQMRFSKTAQRERAATAEALVRLVAARLDNNFWMVNYESQSKLIKVQSRHPDFIEPEFTINGPAFEKRKPTLHNFGFSLRVEPLVAPADYARFQAENAAIDAQLVQTQTQMKSISHKFDSYSPHDAAEKTLVDTYNSVKAKRHSLPLFYFRDISLSVAFYDGHPIFDWDRLFDSEVQTERLPRWKRQQEAAALEVAQLLTRYETPKK